MYVIYYFYLYIFILWSSGIGLLHVQAITSYIHVNHYLDHSSLFPYPNNTSDTANNETTMPTPSRPRKQLQLHYLSSLCAQVWA